MEKKTPIVPCDMTEYIRTYLQRRVSQTSSGYDGWLAFTSWNYTGGPTIDAFIGNFSVPVAPRNPPEVLYLFTGLQNVDWIPIIDPEPPVFDIIQPVLQYPGDNGNYWSVKSWYVTLDQGVVVSAEIRVAVGDQVFGNMTMTGSDTWYIAGVNAQGQVSSIDVTRARLAKQPWAYNTAEGYGVTGCSYEPTNSCDFTGLTLTANGVLLTPQWVAFQSPDPMCYETAHILSPSSVQITFQKTD